MKIRFESYNKLPVNKKLNIPLCVVAVSGVLRKDSKYYPQVLLHECYYEYEHEENTSS